MALKLTSFSKGSGCGCKLSPDKLKKILGNNLPKPSGNLWVGNDTGDDAAVFNFDGETGLILTTDFFTPLVDDPEDFGKIAAANSISDVYAMGGKPIMAVAVLGWPEDKLPLEDAALVMKGAVEICRKAGIPLAGGHSIFSPEPFFGLAVNGLVRKANLRKNSTANAGDLIYLTKPIGSGILGAALKRNLIAPEQYVKLMEVTTSLNLAGELLGSFDLVTAMTDLTGFGLLGHLLEMAKPNNLSIYVFTEKVPLISGIESLMKGFCFPDNTYRNWNAVQPDCSKDLEPWFIPFCDPQTNGGLLVAVKPEERESFESIAENKIAFPFGISLIGEFASFDGYHLLKGK